MKLIIVNFITSIRLIGAFMLPIIYYKCGINITSLIIIILFLTDAIDGFLARKLKVSTFFGCIIDALSDKLLNIISFIILGLEFNTMFAPLIIEIAILYTMYSTYRYGGNIQSSKLGKIKTIILDILVAMSFVLLALPTLNIKCRFTNFLINYTEVLIIVFSMIILTACLVALLDYLKKNHESRLNPKCIEIKHEKRNFKSKQLIIKQLFDINYYSKHKNESIMRQFYI
ncbi:MAG: CDP-alcohol phosphatidyltransferase family protein [Bacilli bacterium]|nr:CDP-alcohol phosphatidyltransferase family protein [Bacilli bacterium]